MSPSESEKKGIGRAPGKDAAGRKPAGKSWFFGIGINEYEHFSNLNNAVKDVKDVLILLQDQYDLDPKRVITLFDEEATRDNIIDKLDDLVELVGPEDKLLLYYSGHGSLNKKTNLAYWIPQDAKRRRTSGYIPNSTIRDYIKAINSFHTLLISDSCFSGTLFVRGAARSDAAIDELAQRRSRWGIVSGRHDEEVYDGEPGANSPFAASILKVLKRNRHDKLNVARLADQVVEMTRSNYTQLPEGNPLFGVGHDGGQYVFRLVGSEANIWERCLAENSLAAFNAYLDRFPNGPHADEALQRIKELEEVKKWEWAGRIDQIYAYRSFLRSFPNGKFAADAKTRIQQLQEGEQEERELRLWNKAKEQDTRSAYEEYLKKFPAGRYADEATARIGELKALEEKAIQEGKAEEAWRQAKQKDTLETYEAFLRQFPGHRYASVAKERLQSIREQTAAWEKAKALGTLSAVEDFRRHFPDSRFDGAVEKLINELREKERDKPAQKVDDERPQPAYSTSQPSSEVDIPFWRRYLPHTVGGILVIVFIVWVVGKVTQKPFDLSTAIIGSISFEGETYGTIQYEPGGLIWMTKNLNYEVPDSWCYDDDPANCAEYGRLYTWEAAKKACQSLGNGWRLPTDQEWRDLAKRFGGADDDAWDDGKAAYQAMIEGGNSGFSARLGGYRISDGSFTLLGDLGGYWGATERGSGYAWFYYFYRKYGKLRRYWGSRSIGRSCRCVQD